MKWGRMPNVSLPLANLIYSVSGVMILIGAVLSLVGSFGALLSDRVRERYADERVAANEAETAKALAEAATANERAAVLNREAAALRLELQKRTQPLVARTLSPEQVQAMRSVLSGHSFAVKLVWGGADPEVVQYAGAIRTALRDCGLQVELAGGEGGANGANVMVVDGVRVAGPKGENLARLSEALVRADIQFQPADPPPFVGKDEIVLVVGTRPALQ